MYAGVNELRLCEDNRSIVLFLYLASHEVANFPLIIEGEILSAVVQLGDDLINGFVVGAKDDLIIDVDQEDDGLMVVQARVELARRKTDRLHPLVHVLIPHSSSLLLPIHIAFELKHVSFSSHFFLFVSLGQT